ncbi:MAG TPA: hydrogenase maturation protease [Bacteroidales bacterium]|nr:hydrogenase maturation protease [Bacteroidales bacterium]
MAKILVYGYGNPGRQDDGLGAAFIQLLEAWLMDHPELNVETDCNYQLNIEDAAAVAGKDIVVFVDATLDEEVSEFRFGPVNPSDARIEFTMHAVSPSFVLDLCRKINGSCPKAWLLEIRGYSWDFEERISQEARHNLTLALGHLKTFLIASTQEKVVN